MEPGISLPTTGELGSGLVCNSAGLKPTRRYERRISMLGDFMIGILPIGPRLVVCLTVSCVRCVRRELTTQAFCNA